jgi:hypothetical protein
MEAIQDRFDAIIKEIEQGSSLRKILSQKGYPSSQTFYKWISEDEIKAKQYARACEVRSDLIFDEILEIADDPREDAIVTDNGIVMNTEFVQRSKLRIDARKWVLAKMNPKKYGDKVENTIVGDNEKPIIINLGSGIDPKNEQSQ